MTRIVFNLASAVSLLLCMGTGVLWVLSGSTAVGFLLARRSAAGPQTYIVHTRLGGLRYFSFPHLPYPDQVSGGFFTDPPHYCDFQYGSYDSFALLGFLVRKNIDHQRVTDVTVPMWALMLLFSFLPAASILAWRKGRSRLRQLEECRCPECGYDLRATPGRCPECGTAPTRQGAT